MLEKLAKSIALVALLFIAACSRPDSGGTSEPGAAEEAAVAADAPPTTPVDKAAASDPTVLDPDRYSVEFENEAVRILRIRYGVGDESVMHSHPESVAVFLTNAKAQLTLADGSSQTMSVAAGDFIYGPGGAHRPANTGDSPFEVVEIELKQRDAGDKASEGPDPTVVDADHYTTAFENDSVRVLRIAYGAAEASTMHYHPDSVAVFTTDHAVQMTMPDGSTDEITASAGDTLFVGAGQHLPKNIADSTWELLLIELKR
jgi:quercetin dioxygenase-like cupin family protein